MAAAASAASGLLPTEIGRRLAVPKSTLQYWLRGGRDPLRTPPPRRPCPRCDGAPLDDAVYAYLLGAYLGDGHITDGARTAVLAIYCADDYPGVSAEIQDAVRGVMPSCRVSVAPRTGCHAVKSHSLHWSCLFPQHGPGLKHSRVIALEPWQQVIVERRPESLLRGLFHSDGCRNLNWATKTTADGTKRYEYVRYLFSNESEDILRIAEDAVDRLDVPHRRPRRNMISVAKRAGTARLDEFIGAKY